MTKPRRLLVISPNFPPLNTADQHRIRVALPHLRGHGWETTVLCLEPAEGDGVPDPDLLRTIPDDIRVLRHGALPRRYTRLVGLGSTGLRSLPFLLSLGNRLLKREEFDLAFFSTTVFPVMAAGPRWRRRFGLPYVLDFQDPWRNDYYDRPGAPPPPGGRLKYRLLARPVAAAIEPGAVRGASGIVSVSPDYCRSLARRYGVPDDRFTTLPFAASSHDAEIARSSSITQDVFDPADGLRHWVSIGAATPAYAPLIRIVFEEFARIAREEPKAAADVRLHFVGTSYTNDPARQGSTVRDLAREAGIADLVEERPGRIPYLSALKAMTESDAVLAIGNTDPAHTASKIYPAVLSGRPLLAFYHEASTALRILSECRAGLRAAWSGHGGEAMRQEVSENLRKLLLGEAGAGFDMERFRVYTDRGMTERLCNAFSRAAEEGAA